MGRYLAGLARKNAEIFFITDVLIKYLKQLNFVNIVNNHEIRY
jgi:hypothetical protein